LLRKRAIVIGATGVGKTTLIKKLKGNGSAMKTQTISFEDEFIDIPGEYLDIPRLNYAVINTAMEAAMILVVQDSTSIKPTTPPNFCGMFNIPVYGVISKIDDPSCDIAKAKENLRMCGVREIYSVSSITGEGIEELKSLVEKVLKS